MESNTVFNKDFDAASVFVMKVYHADVIILQSPNSLTNGGRQNRGNAKRKILIFKKAEDGIM